MVCTKGAAMSRKRDSILLVMVQALIVPSYGFTYTPHCIGTSRSAPAATARHASFAGALSRPLNAAGPARGSLSGIFMSETPFDAYGEPTGRPDGDEKSLPPPAAYDGEHAAGGNRFRELLARANRGGDAAAPPSRPAPQARPPPPPRPQGSPINYDNDDEWEDRTIGSPALPDLPLRNEMPGLALSPELDYSGPAGRPVEEESGGPSIASGSRFNRMMSQAQSNDQRLAAGAQPKTSPRSPQQEGGPPPPPPPRSQITQAERDRALKQAVVRQQKLMDKAKGIYVDDATLSGPELAKKKALNRAQAGASAGGYVPSSTSADDYMNALKLDSKQKTAEKQAALSGKPIPHAKKPPLTVRGTASPAPGELQSLAEEDEFENRFDPAPQKRTRAMAKINNKADVYMASLKGIEVEITDNPHMAQQPSLIEQEPLPPMRSILSPPPAQKPATPSLSYKDKLRLAREGKLAGAGAPQTAAPAAAVSTSIRAELEAPAPAKPTLSYAEKLNQAHEARAEAASGVDATARSAPAPLPQSVPPTRAPIPARSSVEGFDSDFQGEDVAQTKIMGVMDLLTQHKTAGLVGEERVAELRKALAETREFLRVETYDQSAPVSSVQTAVQPTSTEIQQYSSEPEGAVPINEADQDSLRRCSALLKAHVHSALTGDDLDALREGLASSLAIVQTQGGGQVNAKVVAQESVPAVEMVNEPVPKYVGGIQSVGGVLSDMSVGKKPERFEPENDSGGKKGWTGGSFGAYEKGVATKALGYLLKHRGGKGYGRGRVKGAEADTMVSTLAELTEIMHEEMVET